MRCVAVVLRQLRCCNVVYIAVFCGGCQMGAEVAGVFVYAYRTVVPVVGMVAVMVGAAVRGMHLFARNGQVYIVPVAAARIATIVVYVYATADVGHEKRKPKG